MRNYSRQIPNTYYKFQSLPRNYTQEKRLQELHTLKESQVKVGIYKYSTEDELGKGYSSKVYKGVQIQKIHKRYAIKVIELKKFRGSSLEMLEAEIQIHKNLVHQNILRLYEVIKTPYFYYLILEYCPHGNLHEYIKQKKKLTQSNAAEIMDQVLSGFKYLIQQGVIHRDLKPANILRIGNKWKISDFGFSVKSKYGFKDRINVGTPLYMPPESLKKSYYSSKSDIFALGVILYQMVQGTTPWQSSNEKELLQKIKTEIIVPDHLKSALIRDFIYKACQLNENKRISKQEIMEYQIRLSTNPSDIKNQKISERQSAIAMTSHTNSKQHSRKQSFTTEQLPVPPKPVEDFEKLNNQVLLTEFSLVKHIYSCIKNIDSFLIDPEDRQFFTLILFKLLLKLIRFLCDKKTNHHNLKNWLEYITSKAYNELYKQMIELSQLYQKQYLEHIKQNDIKIIRNVNKKYPDLCHNAPISSKFYETLKEYLVGIIRGHNHQLMILQSKFDQSSQEKILEIKINQASNHKDQPIIAIQETKPAKDVIRDDQKQQINSSSAPRKVYESKRSIKRVSEFKIDDPIFSNRPQQDSQEIVQQKPDKQISLLQDSSSKQIASQLKQKETKQNIQKNEQNKQAHIISQTSILAQQQLTINDKIQALQSLYAIYRTCQLRAHSDDKQISERIKVISNYLESTLNKRDYIDLRRLIRGI